MAYNNYGAPGYGAPSPGYGAPRAGPGGAPPPHGGYGAPAGGPGYGGGFAPQPPAVPTSTDDQELWQWFAAVDIDRSGAISVTELSRALVNGNWSPFDIDTVKLLMHLFDTDYSGTIGFREFATLWKYIKDWQNVFNHFDKDRSDSIDHNELREALNQFGYRLNPSLVDLVVKKYEFKGPAPGTHPAMPIAPGGKPPPVGINFDRFVRACVVIKQLSETFQRFDDNKDGWIQISYEQFMDAVLRLP